MTTPASPIVLPNADLGIPRDPAALFARPGPVVLEIGFGDGTFLDHLASTHPGWNLLGAEVSLGSVSRAFRRMRRAGHRHVRLFRGDARFLVRDVCPPGSLHRLYVNFPDPWPKKRHRDRRLLQTAFFRLAASRLADGGALLFTTDHAEYFAFALEQAAASEVIRTETAPPPPATLTTKYARKWRAQDKPIQHAVFHKVATPADTFPPLVVPDAMHHAYLAGTLPGSDALDAFDKQVHAFEGGHVIVLEAYKAVSDGTLAFAVRVEEEALTQELLVEARTVQEGVRVGVQPWGQPLATRGTREAVGVVARWLEAHGLEETARFY